MLTKARGCYANFHENVTGDYFDRDQDDILEIVLWQHLFTATGMYRQQPVFNLKCNARMKTIYEHRKYVLSNLVFMGTPIFLLFRR